MSDFPFEKCVPNDQLFTEIITKYGRIYSKESIYSTHIRIAAKTFVEYLNTVDNGNTEVQNSGIGNGSFAIKKSGQFIVNIKKVENCIKQCRKGKGMVGFSFLNMTIVLERLIESLESRNN